MDAEEWNERYAATDLLWSAEPNRFVAECVGPLPPGRALDLAAGEGRNAVWLAERGWAVTAVDFSDVAIEKGREIARRRDVPVDWHVADVVTWIPENRYYDLALIAYLQLPAPERNRVWRAAAEAVAPDGTLVVIGHDARNLTDGYGGPDSPAVLYTADDVVAAIGDLEVVRAGEVIRPVERSDSTTAAAIDCLVIAHRAAL